MAIPPIPGRSLATLQEPGKNFITGDSLTFASTVGSWVAFGSNQTVSRETGASSGFPSGSGQNLKITSTQGNGADGFGVPSSGVRLTVAPTGGFKAGRTYVFKFYAAYEIDPFAGAIYSYITAYVVPPSGAISLQGNLQPYFWSSAPYQWQLVTVPWVCVTNVASVNLTLGRADINSGTQTFHIAGHAQYGPRLYIAEAMPQHDTHPVYGGTSVTGDLRLHHNLFQGTNGGFSPHIVMANNSVELQGRSSDDFDAGTIVAGYEGYVGLYAPHTSPSDFADTGINLEAGDDYVGIYISEKDADTVQMYPDWSSGYDIELKDRGSGRHWRAVSEDGSVNKILTSMSERVASNATATVTSGSTSVTVSHGLSFTPTSVQIRVTPTNNPTNDPGNFWISNIDSDSFDINVRSDPGAGGATFAWAIER